MSYEIHLAARVVLENPYPNIKRMSTACTSPLPADDLLHWIGHTVTPFHTALRQHTVDGPAKSESPGENGGKHPMIFIGFRHFSTIPGGAGFRWPIHSMLSKNGRPQGPIAVKAC